MGQEKSAPNGVLDVHVVALVPRDRALDDQQVVVWVDLPPRRVVLLAVMWRYSR
jgi:hypothetical protein